MTIPRLYNLPCVALLALSVAIGSALLSQEPHDNENAGKTDDGASKPTRPNAEILTDTEGVDFKPYLAEVHRITDKAWQPNIPKDVNPPKLQRGMLVIRFKILRTGQVGPKSMVLEGRSGHMKLDRAAWYAIANSSYPPLPEEFKGPFIELRFVFMYNMEPK